MGALIGATYGMFMVQLGLLPQRLVVNLVIFSMAGYFAAIIRAPFTAIILITEMVGSLLHLMPLAVVAFIALLVDELLGGKPIYGLLAAAMDTSSDRKANYTGEADQMVLPVYESSKLVDKKVADIKCLMILELELFAVMGVKLSQRVRRLFVAAICLFWSLIQVNDGR